MEKGNKLGISANFYKKGELPMSTLEKTISLLQEMPEQTLESIYNLIYSVWTHQDTNIKQPENIFTPDIEDIDSIIGIAHEQANTALAEKRQKGFQGLMSFAGTLPDDFDYKKELDEVREEKYARFS